jgi:hypothetical protein
MALKSAFWAVVLMEPAPVLLMKAVMRARISVVSCLTALMMLSVTTACTVMDLKNVLQGIVLAVQSRAT